MQRSSKLWIVGSTLLLLLLYVTPMWQIDLTAPQYPEGLGLFIWINKISGQNPGDLKTINLLNHYIGMKAITPSDIPELTYMPYIVGAIISLGLLVAWTGNKKLLYIWVTMFLMVLIAGLIDFYLWEYDYGHNLEPKAPIKVPGMTYQPPLIGVKQLLNMTTLSIPYTGGVAAGVAFLIGLAVAWREFRNQSKEQKT